MLAAMPSCAVAVGYGDIVGGAIAGEAAACPGAKCKAQSAGAHSQYLRGEVGKGQNLRCGEAGHGDIM